MDYKNYIQLTISQGVKLNIGKAISDGFSHLGKNVGAYVGFAIISFFITIAASLFAMFIPIIGGIAVGVLVSPALLMGFAIFARKTMLNENPTFENFFDAFKINYTQLILVNLIIQVIQLGLVTLVLIPLFADAFTFFQDPGAFSDPDMIEEFAQEMVMIMLKNWWVFALYIVVSMVIQVLYMLANYFVIFYGFGFWEAMETSRQLVGKVFIEVILLYIGLGIIVAVGSVFTLGVGLLFLFPASVLVTFSVFSQVAGFAEPDQNLEDDLLV